MDRVRRASWLLVDDTDDLWFTIYTGAGIGVPVRRYSLECTPTTRVTLNSTPTTRYSLES